MAYTPHFLLQFGGTLGTQRQEIWSCGIRLWVNNGIGLDEVGYLSEVAAPALEDWMQRPTSKVGDTCSLTFAKFNEIDPLGHYVKQDTEEFVYPGNGIPGGSGTPSLPFQATVVLTWRTDAASRGPASKGRIYSPAPYVQVSGSTGLFAVADAQAMATSAAELLNTLDVGTLDDPLRPSIMSTIGGAHHQIDSVTVDNRVDTQRRRANNLVGALSSAPVDY